VVECLSQYVEVRYLTTCDEGKTAISHPDLHRPGMGLMGYMTGYLRERVQILGRSECGYLSSIGETEQRASIRAILELDVPGIFVSEGEDLSQIVVEEANRSNTPVVVASTDTDELTELLHDVLSGLFAQKATLHGTLVDVYGVGLLLTGRSGIGKSETALDLVERGHRLVADDLVQLVRRSSDILVGTKRDGVGQLLEIRGIGIVDLMPMFGVRAVRMQKRVEVEVRLEEWDDDKDYDRHGLDRDFTHILGVKIPRVIVPIVAGKNSTVIAEALALDLQYDALSQARYRVSGDAMRALVVTHGVLGRALVESAREIYDVDAPIEAMSNHGRDAVALREGISAWLAADEGPAIVLVDVGGGSCGIAARMAAAGRPSTWILGGANLPMVLTFLSSHAALAGEALVAKLLDRALNAVDILGDPE
jgi:HPr kinase/phosphorylase